MRKAIGGRNALLLGTACYYTHNYFFLTFAARLMVSKFHENTNWYS